jgi:hypothetical protein
MSLAAPEFDVILLYQHANVQRYLAEDKMELHPECPNCGRSNPDSALQCECGHSFKRTAIEELAAGDGETPSAGSAATALIGGILGGVFGFYVGYSIPCSTGQGGDLCGILGIFLFGPCGLVIGSVGGAALLPRFWPRYTERQK